MSNYGYPLLKCRDGPAFFAASNRSELLEDVAQGGAPFPVPDQFESHVARAWASEKVHELSVSSFLGVCSSGDGPLHLLDPQGLLLDNIPPEHREVYQHCARAAVKWENIDASASLRIPARADVLKRCAGCVRSQAASASMQNRQASTAGFEEADAGQGRTCWQCGVVA